MKQEEIIYNIAKKHSKLEERECFEDALNEFAKWKDQEALGFLYAIIRSSDNPIGQDMILTKISQLEERIAKYECQ